MIQNGITRFDIAQQIDQRNLISLRPRQRAHDEVEIGSGEPRPTIRPDHRDFIVRDSRAESPDIFCYGSTGIYTDQSRSQEKDSELPAFLL